MPAGRTARSVLGCVLVVVSLELTKREGIAGGEGRSGGGRYWEGGEVRCAQIDIKNPHSR